MPPRQHQVSAEPWTRERLRIVLAATTIVLVALTVGTAVIWAKSLTHSAPEPAPAAGHSADPVESSSVPLRDRIAAAPMTALDPAAATVPDPATDAAHPIHIPLPLQGSGPADIPTYPDTPEGAVAQLAAIDQTVLATMSIAHTREVHDAWVLPGGPSFEQWDLTSNVTAFLRGARQGSTKDLTTTVHTTPAGGMIKGTDGPDWVVACVLLDIQASIRDEYRMGWGHCQRMQWVGSRWQIAPGTQPAQAPSAWPGSKAALAAGWLTWTEASR